MMSNILAKLYRSEDNQIIQIRLNLDYKGSYDRISVSFTANNKNISILSSSDGSIDSQGNLEIKNLSANLYVEYSNANTIECLVGYYSHNNELIYYENLISPIASNKEIQHMDINTPVINTISGSFQNKWVSFFEILTKRDSSWNINISAIDKEISVKILSTGDIPIMVSFGEKAVDVLISDYIFQAFPGVSHLNIPKEILKRQYNLYQPHCQLGVYELVKPDFINSGYIYYKNLISNTLSLSEIAK